jgi:hypothetical protein
MYRKSRGSSLCNAPLGSGGRRGRSRAIPARRGAAGVPGLRRGGDASRPSRLAPAPPGDAAPSAQVGLAEVLAEAWKEAEEAKAVGGVLVLVAWPNSFHDARSMHGG